MTIVVMIATTVTTASAVVPIAVQIAGKSERAAGAPCTSGKKITAKA